MREFTVRSLEYIRLQLSRTVEERTAEKEEKKGEEDCFGVCCSN